MKSSIEAKQRCLVTGLYEQVLRVRRHEQWYAYWNDTEKISIAPFLCALSQVVEAITGPKPLDVLSCPRRTTERGQ